jgi:hypothetical protein
VRIRLLRAVRKPKSSPSQRAIVATLTAATVALALFSVAFAAQTRQSAKIYRIGVLATSATGEEMSMG